MYRRMASDPIDVRLRRVRCRSCQTTRLLPAALQPRRADATEVIGTALAAKPQAWGTGRSPSRWADHRRPCAAGCGAPVTTLI